MAIGIEEIEGPGPEECRISDQEVLTEYEISLRFLHKGMVI
jgi:hypothetical protein